MQIVRSLGGLLCAGSLFASCTGSSPTWTSSPDQTSVNTCITNASSGDTINVSSGSATWSGLTVSKGLTLAGGNGGTTTIAGVQAISIITTSTSFRITGFSFSGAGESGAANIELTSSGGATDAPYRIDHNTFTNASAAVFIEIAGNGTGLIDHNTFTAQGAAEEIHNLGMGASSEAGWEDSITPGSPNMVYVETNNFNNTDTTFICSGIESFYGSRNVIRDNTTSFCQFDQHGTAGAIGARWWEIYNNTFTVPAGQNQCCDIVVRDGSGVIFGNTQVLGSGSSGGDIELYSDNSGTWPLAWQIGAGLNDYTNRYTPCSAASGRAGTGVNKAPAYVWGNAAAMTVDTNGNPSGTVYINEDFFVSMNQPSSMNWVEKSGDTCSTTYVYTPFLYPYPLTANGMPNPAVGLPNPPVGPLQFLPITPCRVVDTRSPAGSFGSPELAPETTRTFNIPAGACGIPSNAAAYSLNVTVVPNAQLSYLSIWPSGQNQPVVSTLNSDGRIKANAAIVAAGSNGGIDVSATDPTQLIIDINGYFVPATTSTLAFYPLTPCRIADTRAAAGPLGGPFLSSHTSRAFPILSSSCAIPDTANAYSLNFTVVPHGALDYISVWPQGQAQPVVSTLNALTGAITANAAIVPAGSSGGISVYASDDTDLVVDVNGYFAPPASGGLSLYTLTPCRALDTRDSSGEFNGTMTAGIIGSACGALTSAAQAFVLNATVVPPGALIYLTLWPDGEAQPTVSTLNAVDGAITSNMAIVPATNGSISAYGSNPTQLILDISGFFGP